MPLTLLKDELCSQMLKNLTFFGFQSTSKTNGTETLKKQLQEKEQQILEGKYPSKAWITSPGYPQIHHMLLHILNQLMLNCYRKTTVYECCQQVERVEVTSIMNSCICQ